MNIWDYLIVLLPLAAVICLAVKTQKYARSVADYLSAGRLCGRYVISVADVVTGLSVIGLVAAAEVNYQTGFALSFWQNLLMPLTVIMSLTGYCFYRFRETRAMSLGQFLELRYDRKFRIFAASLRSVSEMLTNMIGPAVAARFFIYFLDLPHRVTIGAWQVPTFALVVFILLALAVTIIWLGGTLALVVTDTLQGLICYPMLVLFIVFVLCKFSWSGEVIEVMTNRVSGESFLNPYDIKSLRDFNFFALGVLIFSAVLNRASWIGAGSTSAGRTPHEQKMAGVLGTWRTGFSSVFYVLLAIALLTLLNHPNYRQDAREVRTAISGRVAGEVVENVELRAKLAARLDAIPPQIATAPLSRQSNLDTVYLDQAHQTLLEGRDGHLKFQEFRTLYNQMMLPMTMRHLLPAGMLGLFCLLMVLMMLSTDDSRIFSAALTITQDVILPLRKKPLSPRAHINLLRLMSVAVALFFFAGSFLMAQLDYINLFMTIMASMWLGGAGPVMIFGLYSRFGTTAGAFASLITGMVVSLGGILVQRNWADYVYPWLDRNGLARPAGEFLTAVSAPFNPYIVWEMNPVKFPVNSVEISLIAMLAGIAAYLIGSRVTRGEPFNLDRMLHRGEYSVDGTTPAFEPWTVRTVFSKLIGITPEYTRGDRVIAWAVFGYSFVYMFGLGFLAVAVWNFFAPWKLEWWSHYFLLVALVIPGLMAAVTAVWFSIGGVIDLRRLFRDLAARQVDDLDDGRVEGNVSLADKSRFEHLKK
ncbi:MAG: sodium:solute symporter [Victivallaceae bacterium]